jgi:hypothetical protein
MRAGWTVLGTLDGHAILAAMSRFFSFSYYYRYGT